MPIYADYLSVNQDFVPVFSNEVDSREPQKWKSFIPHEGLTDLLRELLKSLERARIADCKSLLMHGTYGTGKTYAAFVVKHLLEDNWQDVEGYFAHYTDVSADYDHLKQRLAALRQSGKYLVVYRSGSDYLDSSFKLLALLQESIREALERQGLEGAVTPTLYDQVLGKLTGADTPFNWQSAFSGHRGSFTDFASADAVVQRLKSSNASDPESVKLMERVWRVMQESGFVVLDDPEEVKTWIKEIVDRHKLAGIVFIWDEFTGFFVRNRDTSTLQELAHATASIPFYLLLITHRPLEIAGRMTDQDDWKRLLDRFARVHYQMEPVTAYELMGAAIQVRAERRDQWETVRNSMFSSVASLVRPLLQSGGEREDFRRLVPIHPYAAFLLSVISSRMSSSERTLFRFLQDDAIGSFPRFLREDTADGWSWYTGERLWDYFFLDESMELGDRVQDVVGYYRSRAETLKSEDEKVAFKAILLLIALHREMGGELGQVRPTDTNIRLMLVGTGLQDRTMDVIHRLAHDDVIRRLPSITGGDEYTIAASTVDETRVKQIRNSAVPSFLQIARESGALGEQVIGSFTAPDTVSRRRHHLTAVSAADFIARRERVLPQAPRHFEIPVCLILAVDDEELERAAGVARAISGETGNAVLVLSRIVFGGKAWEDWRDQCARALYYRETKDLPNERFHQERAEQLVKARVDQISQGAITVFFRGRERVENGADGLYQFLREVVSEVYPYRPELITTRDTLYQDSGYGKASALIGLNADSNVTAQFEDIVGALIREGFWPSNGEQKGFDLLPDHPVSRMKRALDERFAAEDSVSLDDISAQLQAPPFGLIPSHAAMVILGLLMRDYCQGYFWSDGSNYHPLDVTKMAELLDKTLKGRGNAFICRMTPEATRFCEVMQRIFGLKEEDSRYPERARDAARDRVNELGYPVWMLKYANSESSAPRTRAIDVTAWLLRDTASAQLDNNAMIAFLDAVDPRMSLLRSQMVRSDLEKGFTAFVQQAEPRLLPAAEKLGVSTPAVLADQLSQLLSEAVWLWEEEKVKSRLPELADRLALTHALNEMNGTRLVELDEAIQATKERAGRCKLPVAFLAESVDQDARTTLVLLGDALRQGSEFRSKSELAEGLLKHLDGVRGVFLNPELALANWAESERGIAVDAEDAQQAWEKLPNLSNTLSMEEVKRAATRAITDLRRSRLARELRNRWRALTGTESVSAWSKDRSLPLTWVLEGQQYSTLFYVVDHASSQDEASLEKALRDLGEHESSISHLSDEKSVDSAFVSAVAPGYEELLSDPRDIAALKAHLRHELGIDVSRWLRNEAARQARQWLTQLYQNRFYSVALNRIDNLTERELRQLLREMAARPSVGLSLLKRREDLA